MHLRWLGLFIAAALATALATLLGSCGGGPFPIPIFGGDEWSGPPYEYGGTIIAPDAAAAGAATTITAEVRFGSRAQTVYKEEVKVLPEQRRVEIKIVARSRSGCFPCDVPPPIYLEFPVVFGPVGEWIITTKTDSHTMLAYGEWLGTEQPAKMVDYVMWHQPQVNSPAPLRVITEHEGREWVCSRRAIEVDEANKTVRIDLFERPADTGLTGSAWRENTVIPLTFPTEGHWHVQIGEDMMCEHLVQDYWEHRYDASLTAAVVLGRTPREFCPWGTALPTGLQTPEGAVAGELLDCTLTFLNIPVYGFEFIGADYYFDVPDRILYAFCATSTPWVTEDDEDAITVDCTTRLRFPAGGEWRVVFHSRKGVDYDTVVLYETTVVIEEGTAQ